MHEKCADKRRQQEWLSWATKGLPSSKFSLQWWLKAASGEKQCKGAAPSVPSPELLPHSRVCTSGTVSAVIFLLLCMSMEIIPYISAYI